MATLEIIDSGILYINPDPAHYHVFASHAHPLQLSAQEFVATYQRGDGMYAVNGNIALTRSLDGGVTWQPEGFLHDKTGDDRPYSYHDGFLSRLGDGTLVVLAFRADRSQPDKPMFSASGGLIENEPVLFFSTDGGHTWSQPQPIQLPAASWQPPPAPLSSWPMGDGWPPLTNGTPMMMTAPTSRSCWPTLQPIVGAPGARCRQWLMEQPSAKASGTAKRCA